MTHLFVQDNAIEFRILLHEPLKGLEERVGQGRHHGACGVGEEGPQLSAAACGSGQEERDGLQEVPRVLGVVWQRQAVEHRLHKALQGHRQGLHMRRLCALVVCALLWYGLPSGGSCETPQRADMCS